MKRLNPYLLNTLIITIFLILGISTNVSSENLSLETNPSADEPANISAAVKVEVSKEIIEKSIPHYSFSLKKLIREAENNLRKIEKEMKQKEIWEESKRKEREAYEYFEKGNLFYSQGRLQEAKENWQKALTIASSPEMRRYIKQKKKELIRQEAEKKIKEKSSKEENRKQKTSEKTNKEKKIKDRKLKK